MRGRLRQARIPQVDGAGDQEEPVPKNIMASARSDALVDEESLFDSWLTEPEFPAPGNLTTIAAKAQNAAFWFSHTKVNPKVF